MSFYRSLIVEDVTGSQKLVRNLALQGVVRGLKDKRQGDIVLRVYISCARSTSAWIHIVGLTRSNGFKRSQGSKSEK